MHRYTYPNLDQEGVPEKITPDMMKDLYLVNKTFDLHCILTLTKLQSLQAFRKRPFANRVTMPILVADLGTDDYVITADEDDDSNDEVEEVTSGEEDEDIDNKNGKDEKAHPEDNSQSLVSN